jgi:2-polyprenyl-3-methyl-5-hydroxy-6-metoxy-1,4-benzoquinol methylase
MDDSSQKFVAYYAQESLSDRTRDRFLTIRDKAIGLARAGALDVLDIGCGAGTQALLWAELGHRVRGIDISAELVDIARKRSQQAGFTIAFDVGTATELALDAGTIDVCLLPELLEHVPDWESCLREAIRVLRPGGVLYLSTTNAFCPKQQEFGLPLYSWYPRFLKRRFERLAVTTWPGLVQHASYPAVNWFTPYELSRFLAARGLQCKDRFDMIDVRRLSGVKRMLVELVRSSRAMRFLGHVCTPGTLLFAVKTPA